MTYDANLTTVDVEIERLRPERRRHGPRNPNNLIPAVEMIIGDWHVDEHIDPGDHGARLATGLGVRTVCAPSAQTARSSSPLTRPDFFHPRPIRSRISLASSC